MYREVWTAKGQEGGFLGGDGNILLFFSGGPFTTIVKTYWTVYSKWIQFLKHKLFLNKIGFKEHWVGSPGWLSQSRA